MNNWGFSYLEMAISIVIMAVVYTGFMSAFSQLTSQDYYQSSQNSLEQVQKAIDRHLVSTGYLPCPASLVVAETSSGFGASTDCAVVAPSGVTDSNTGVNMVRVGGIPFKNLNLPASSAYDSWNNRIIYAVVKNLAVTSASFISNTPASAFSIKDKSGNLVPSSANTAYILVSLGQDGKGAYNTQGVVLTQCQNGIEVENCNNDHVFVTAPFNDGDTSNKFDDLVVYKTRAQLINDNKLMVTP